MVNDLFYTFIPYPLDLFSVSLLYFFPFPSFFPYVCRLVSAVDFFTLNHWSNPFTDVHNLVCFRFTLSSWSEADWANSIWTARGGGPTNRRPTVMACYVKLSHLHIQRYNTFFFDHDITAKELDHFRPVLASVVQ